MCRAGSSTFEARQFKQLCKVIADASIKDELGGESN